MSRPGLPAGVASTVDNAHVPLFPLVRMEFDAADGGTLYIAGYPKDVTYDGNVYLSSRGLASVEPLVETSDEVTGLKFTLSGVPQIILTEALLIKYQGRLCTVLLAFLDGETMHVDPEAWQGRLDVPEIARTKDSRTITITAEHRMIDWRRPRRLLFNDADQRRIDPTDTFFVGIESMEERTINLFSREVMKQPGGLSVYG
jgi:hypothetical protein